MRHRRILARAAFAASAAWLTAGLLVGAPGGARADGGGGSEGSQAPLSAVREDPDYTDGVQAIKKGDWATAIRRMETVVAKDARNADAYNWLAYATRRQGDSAKAIPIYEKALQLDPKHRGAHEYIGEAYLVLGNLSKAKEHLARLDKLCFFPCSQYPDLKQAVQTYEASGGQVKPTSQRVP